MPDKKENILDLLGVGIGPSNLSLAALLSPIKEKQSLFLDSKEEFQWHPGMLFSNATIQVSYLKDLVTLVDPTNPYSFLNFLKSNKRLYRFVTAQFPGVKRREFNQYFKWASENLKSLQFSTPVLNIDTNGENFVIEHANGVEYARNIVLGSGLTEQVPEVIRPYVSSSVFHAIHFMHKRESLAGKRVAIVGGGQSGAEIFRTILDNPHEIPESVTWISRRPNLLPIDNSPFVNEYFFPPYSEYFFQLDGDKKKELIAEQGLASDGINNDLLADIYRRLYELELIDGNDQFCRLLTNQCLIDFNKSLDGWNLVMRECMTDQLTNIDVDVVICATGFTYQAPSYLENISGRMETSDDQFVFNDDFSINWDGPAENKIFIQNGARHARGVSDPNLSLMAWRSAKIINSLLGTDHYDLADESTALTWLQHEQAVHNGYAHHYDF